MTTVTKNTVTDSRTLQLLQHPTFRAEVNRVANAKCREAIRTGRLQFVPLRHAHPPARYIPRMDLVDDPSSSNLSAVFEIPGVKLNGLSLQINDGNLVVRGERRPPYNITHSRQAVAPNTLIDSASGSASPAAISHTDNQSPRFPVQELYFGNFHRSIPLPVGIKQTDITADLMDGMLTVTWPRSPLAIGPSIPSRTPANTSPPVATMSVGTAMQ